MSTRTVRTFHELSELLAVDPGVVFVNHVGELIFYSPIQKQMLAVRSATPVIWRFPLNVDAKPLRDVGKDPRKGDVVQWRNGGGDRIVEAVTDVLVAYAYADGSSVHAATRAGWARSLSNGELEVVSRASDFFAKDE